MNLFVINWPILILFQRNISITFYFIRLLHFMNLIVSIFMATFIEFAIIFSLYLDYRVTIAWIKLEAVQFIVKNDADLWCLLNVSYQYLLSYDLRAI